MRYLLVLLCLFALPALADPMVTPVQIGNQKLMAVVDDASQVSTLPADMLANLPKDAFVWSPGTVHVWWREYSPSLSSSGGPMWMQSMPSPEMQIWDHPHVVVKWLYMADGPPLVDVPFVVGNPGTQIVLGHDFIELSQRSGVLLTGR